MSATDPQLIFVTVRNLSLFEEYESAEMALGHFPEAAPHPVRAA